MGLRKRESAIFGYVWSSVQYQAHPTSTRLGGGSATKGIILVISLSVGINVKLQTAHHYYWFIRLLCGSNGWRQAAVAPRLLTYAAQGHGIWMAIQRVGLDHSLDRLASHCCAWAAEPLVGRFYPHESLKDLITKRTIDKNENRSHERANLQSLWPTAS